MIQTTGQGKIPQSILEWQISEAALLGVQIRGMALEDEIDGLSVNMIRRG